MKGKTRRREWKEICLGQKTSRKRRGGEKGKKYAWGKRRAGKDEEERRERNMPGAKELPRTSGVRRGTSTRTRTGNGKIRDSCANGGERI
jgi:hypothetical protein